MDEPNISRLDMKEARFEGEARLSEVSRGSRCLFRDCEPFSSRNSLRTKHWLLEALELQLNLDNFERTVNFNEEFVLLRICAPSSRQLE